MSINLPTRLSVIIFRTERKATYLYMTLGNVPKGIQQNTKEKYSKTKFGLALVYIWICRLRISNHIPGVPQQ